MIRVHQRHNQTDGRTNSITALGTASCGKKTEYGDTGE